MTWMLHQSHHTGVQKLYVDTVYHQWGSDDITQNKVVIFVSRAVTVDNMMTRQGSL